jgi:hypothetical protein
MQKYVFFIKKQKNKKASFLLSQKNGIIEKKTETFIA